MTFDGIFELFPHPMYTVGYSSYYGYSLISRSYTMLFVSLIAHMMQLSFLVLVEEPHIERTYGGPPKIDQEKMRVLYDPSSGLFPSQKDPIFLWKFDIFRSGDWATLLTVIYGLLVAFLPENDNFAVGQVIFWRVFHWLGLGAMLWAQSNYQLWTRHFTKRGRSTLEVSLMVYMSSSFALFSSVIFLFPYLSLMGDRISPTYWNRPSLKAYVRP